MSEITRRGFTNGTLTSLLTFSLLETLFAKDLFAAEIRPLAAQWLAELNRMGRDLKDKRLSQTQWQDHVEKLLDDVELPELLKFLDFDAVRKDLVLKDRGERSVRRKLPKVDGLPTNLVFGHQIFAVRKGSSVVPHGHDNMATAFIVMSGKFHGRHYDRIEDDKTTMVIEPTIDRSFGPGEYTTVSDERDNVHWFKATSETAYLFNIHVLGVEPGLGTGRVYIDPNGEKLPGDRIRAKKITGPEAYRLFG